MRRLKLILFSALLLLAAAPTTAVAPLTFSGYWGGELADEGRAIVADDAGNLYIAGMSQSPTLPTARYAAQHGLDAFVAKINADGRTVDYVYWFNATSASDVDESFGIALAPDGGPIVVGHTRSPDFCTLFGSVPGYDTTYNDNSDAFIFKIMPDGSGLAYCTFLGGGDWEIATAVASEPDGSAIVAGGTWSADFPTTLDAAFPQPGGQRDAFVARLSPDGTQLTYATFLGGSGQDEAQAITRDAGGRMLVAGWSSSTDFPTTSGAYQTAPGGSFDAFATALLSDGRLDFSTYLGTDQEERATAVIPHDSGILIAGYTAVPLRAARGLSEGVIWRLSADGGTLLAHRLLGGSGDEAIWGAAPGSDSALLLTGMTTSPDFPITPDAIQPTPAGAPDAFVARLNPLSLRLTYGSYLGGTAEDHALAVVTLPGGDLALTGTTRSPDFPVTPDSFGPDPHGDYDAFITRLPLPTPIEFTLYLPLALDAGFALE